MELSERHSLSDPRSKHYLTLFVAKGGKHLAARNTNQPLVRNAQRARCRSHMCRSIVAQVATRQLRNVLSEPASLSLQARGTSDKRKRKRRTKVGDGLNPLGVRAFDQVRVLLDASKTTRQLGDAV